MTTETIYKILNNTYPFNRQNDNLHTYVQYIIEAKDQKEIKHIQQLKQTFKHANCPNLMRIWKVLKEDNIFHLLYEYHDKSLSERLKQLKQEQELTCIFVQLEEVIQWLIENRLKAEMYFDFMAVNDSNNLKVWLKPEQIQKISLESNAELKKTENIKLFLLEFYETERTRIHMQIEEIFETNQNFASNSSEMATSPSKDQLSSSSQINKNKVNKPNFIINGNTLVFTNNDGTKTEVPLMNQKKKLANQQQTVQVGKDSDNNNNKTNKQQAFRPASKLLLTSANSTNNQNKSKKSQETQLPLKKQFQQPDISKMSIAEKVLYYKKHNNSNNSITSATSKEDKTDRVSYSGGGVVVVKKDSSVKSNSFHTEQQQQQSTSNTNKKNALKSNTSKSSNNDSYEQRSNENITDHQAHIVQPQQQKKELSFDKNNNNKQQHQQQKMHSNLQHIQQQQQRHSEKYYDQSQTRRSHHTNDAMQYQHLLDNNNNNKRMHTHQVESQKYLKGLDDDGNCGEKEGYVRGESKQTTPSKKQKQQIANNNGNSNSNSRQHEQYAQQVSNSSSGINNLQVNQKVLQAKQKARKILQKYGDKLKK